MENTEGQKQVQSIFAKGIDADTDVRLLGQTHASVRDAINMRLHKDGVYRRIYGDDLVWGDIAGRQNIIALVCIGLIVVNGKLVQLFRNTTLNITEIWVDSTKVATHADLPIGEVDPNGYLDMVVDEDNISMTDNVTSPIVLNVQDMLDSLATTDYFADYIIKDHLLQLYTQLDKPIFFSMDDVGINGGLVGGSYSYSIRYVDLDGNRTNWSVATPFIPVPSRYDLRTTYFYPDSKVCGGMPEDGNTRYGIHIRFRVTNPSGYSYVEIKRVANNAATPFEYTSSPEYTQLIYDSSGEAIDIIKNPFTIIDFIDKSGVAWLDLAEEDVLIESTPIKTAKTIRYYDNRIVLGGIIYESRVIANVDGLFKEDNESQIAQPFKKFLGTEGHADIHNQVDYKSYMGGERYGFGIKFVDDYGGQSFVLPVESFDKTKSLKNYEFPNRRDAMSGNSRTLSEKFSGVSEIDNLIARRIDNTLGRTFEVFKPEYYDEATIDDVISIENDDYHPMTPTKCDNGDFNHSDIDDGFRTAFPIKEVEGNPALRTGGNLHRLKYYANGLALIGVDRTKLPDWVKGFSVVRTAPANRVVAQGIGMYALSEEIITTPITKATDKFWFYSPDLDDVIGLRPDLFEDIKNNPANYQIQLVSPLGFTSQIYNFLDTNPNEGALIDIASFAHIYYENELHNGDASGDVGEGDGYTTFGRWRNIASLPANQSTAVSSSSDKIFDILSATEMDGKNNLTYNFKQLPGRARYLELEIDDTMYAYSTPGESSGQNTVNKRFHEPWYIINIVQVGNNVGDNNINIYEEIGHYQKLDSIIGIGSGETGQEFELIDERKEDCCSIVASQEKFIYVDGNKWMDVTNETVLAQWKLDLYNNGFFTYNSTDYYGIYEWYERTNRRGTNYKQRIKFPHYYDTGSGYYYFVPQDGVTIVVSYQDDEPLAIFGGDTYVGLSAFTPIDVGQPKNESAIAYRYFNIPFPHYDWTVSENYNSHIITATRAGGVSYDWTKSTEYELNIRLLRQMAIVFVVESRVNLPMRASQYFPYKNYVIRPYGYDAKLESEEFVDYLEAIGIAGGYATDYPDEYEKWGYGGFAMPTQANIDYSKKLTSRVTSKPLTGFTEKLEFMDRLHYSSRRNSYVINSPALRTFLPTNVYDMQRSDLGEINILYDSFTTRGNNLYAITDRGIALLLTNKADLRDVLGYQVASVATQQGLFIGGEQWLSSKIGCPAHYRRGKAEGNIKLEKGVHVDLLTFPHSRGIILFDGATIANLSLNYENHFRDDLMPNINENNIPTSVFNEKYNEIWYRDPTGMTYVYSFAVNNWIGKFSFNFDKMVSVRNISGTVGNDYKVIGAYNDYIFNSDGKTNIFAHLGEGREASISYVVSPSLNELVDFVDLTIHASNAPSEVQIFNKADFSLEPDSVINELKAYSDELYYSTIPRSRGADRIHNTFIGIKIIEDALSANQLDIYSAKTGVKLIV